jgi:pimeloyl-ACP methyl ester carboxylesterase
MPYLTIAGRRLEYERIEAGAPSRPTLVLLHEGLGSISAWKDFPSRLAHAAGCPALVYSRYGYGRSDPLAAPREVTYLHEEAFGSLPQLLDALAIREPILVGHSDGASIAIIHAGGSRRPVAGIVLLAPHVLVEDVTLAGIEAARRAYLETDLRSRLARHHADADAAFWGWNRIWLDPSFRTWNIEEYLPRIRCPVLVIQGTEDEYATTDQLARIAAGTPQAQLHELQDCRHSPHKDQPAAVVEAVTRFVDRVTA